MIHLLKKSHFTPFIFLLLFLYWFNTDEELLIVNNIVYYGEQLLYIISFVFISAILYLDDNKLKKVPLITIQCLILLGWTFLAFKNYLVFNGDNFHYIISGQSIVEKGVMLDTHKIDSPRSTIIPPILPYIIAFVISIFGENFTIIKIIISLLFISSSVLFLELMKAYLPSRKTAYILTIVAFSSPFLIHASSMVMTEVPYLFTSCFVLWISVKFEKQKEFNSRLILLSIVLSLLCLSAYLSRFIGICLIPAIVLYFFRKIPLKQGFKTILKTFEMKRFILLFSILTITIGGRLIYEKQTSNSNKSTELFNERSQKQMIKNIDSEITMLPSMFDQNLIFRKYTNFKYQLDIKKYNENRYFIYGIILIGFILMIYLNNLIAYYLVFGLLILSIGSKVSDYLAILRYISVFLPFFLYMLIASTVYIVEKILPIILIKKDYVQFLSPILTTTILLSIYTNSSLAMGYLVKIEREKSANGEPYITSHKNFFELAKWCRNKLPKDTYVMSRKPRMFSVYAQVPSCGIRTNKTKQKINIEKELKILKDKKVKYVVIDTFSQLAYSLMVPMINTNGGHFKQIKKIGTTNPAYLFEINY